LISIICDVVTRQRGCRVGRCGIVKTFRPPAPRGLVPQELSTDTFEPFEILSPSAAGLILWKPAARPTDEKVLRSWDKEQQIWRFLGRMGWWRLPRRRMRPRVLFDRATATIVNVELRQNVEMVRKHRAWC
jgi:hypothetical protein